MKLSRKHADDIECLIREDSATYCTISVKFPQAHASFLAGSEITLDAAKFLAEDTVRKAVTTAMEPANLGKCLAVNSDVPGNAPYTLP